MVDPDALNFGGSPRQAAAKKERLKEAMKALITKKMQEKEKSFSDQIAVPGSPSNPSVTP